VVFDNPLFHEKKEAVAPGDPSRLLQYFGCTGKPSVIEGIAGMIELS
jgi:hypothetical protein